MEKDDIKKKLHTMIDAIDSEEQLETIMTFMEPQTVYQFTDWYENLSENESARLNRSLGKAECGEFIDHETVKAKYAKWLK